MRGGGMAGTAFREMFGSMQSTALDPAGGESAWELFDRWEEARYAELILGRTCLDCANCTWDGGRTACRLSGEEVDGEALVSEHGCQAFGV